MDNEQTQVQMSEWQLLQNKVADQHQLEKDFVASVKERRAVVEADQAAKARVHPFIDPRGEILKGTWGAAVDLTTEAAISVKDLSRYVLPLDKLYYGAKSKLEGGTFSEGVVAADQGNAEFNDALRTEASNIAPENQTLYGGATRGILQFMVPYMKLAKFAEVSKFVDALGTGAIIDYTLFDPNQGNLSSLIKTLKPEAQSAVLDFLATDPNDDEALNRMRNAMEGGIVGTALEGVFRVARKVISMRKIKVERAKVDAAEPQTMVTGEEIDKLAKEKGSPEGNPQATPEQSKGSSKPAPEQSKGSSKPAPEGETPEAAKVRRESDFRDTLKLSPDQKAAFNKALMAGDDDAATKILELHDFNADTFDWANIQDAEDIKNIIEVTSDVLSEHIDEVGGGVQTHARTEKLANLVGATPEEVHRLFADVRGDKGISARFHAAKRTMIASAHEVQRLLRAAKENPGDLSIRSAVFKQMQVHGALQAEVKGAQMEIARALNAMKILTEDAADGFHDIEEIIRQFNSKAKTGRGIEKYFDEMLDSLDAGDLDALNRATRQTIGQRAKNITIEFVVNSMLSSIKTHAINTTSNILNTFLYSTDRWLSGSFRYLAKGDKAALREARIDTMRKLSSLSEAWNLSKQAWKDGAPVTDLRQRVEFKTRNAISAEGKTRAATAADANAPELGSKLVASKTEVVRNGEGQIVNAVDFNWMQRAINTLGRFIRVPGRALITGDEFFKAINRNSEIAVLSFRKADEEAIANGLEYGSKKYESFVDKRVKELMHPDNASKEARDIRVDAVEKSRLVTFQENARTDFGLKAERLVNSNSLFKLVFAPFFRTPMNILRQGVFDRTILGLAIKDTRETILHGSPRESAEAIARMTTGMGAMATTYMLFHRANDDTMFDIVGKVPYGSSLKATGVKDYSLRVGSHWYQFNRLDPLGMWMGMVADIKTAGDLFDRSNPADSEGRIMALGQGALSGFMSNVLNKTWMKSLSDMEDFVQTAIETKNPETLQRAWGRFAGGQLGKFIPQIVKSAGAAVEEHWTGQEHTAREAWGVWDNLMSQVPFMDEKLPKKYDILGREITHDKGAIAAVNPFATSPQSDDPVDRELAALSFDIQPMRRSLGGGSLQLTQKEYSKMTGMVGTIPMGSGNLQSTVRDLVSQPEWKTYTHARKVMEIKLLINAAREAARAKMLLDPDFRKKYRDAIQKDALALISDQ